MAQSIKLGDDIMKIVRRESELQSRSIAGQIAHWVRIGRAIEKSGNFDHARISAALAGDIETTELTDEEKDVWLDSFVEKMGQPGADEDTFFARRRQLGQGVGLDTAGNLVRERATHQA
ncbi:ParD-like family protein [uncultured Sphingomonas sp.]|uniref:ParD-like family protein n=1 Tax=uncultured Sphingomonas sp. TaxID=158754 RepID=UPI0025D5D808|nr:ParD-like family protein [uncultured Sphingomonas sp.]